MAGYTLRDLGGHNPYELLGVPATATRAEIHAAHHRLVKLVHPDREGGDGHETTLLNVARAILLDQELRAEYDRAGTREKPQEPGTPEASPTEPSPVSTSVWNDDDVVGGVAPPVTPNAGPPPPYVPPAYQPPQYTQQHWQYYQPPPQYGQPYAQPYQPDYQRRRPSKSGGVSPITVTGLVLATSCYLAPAGLVIGIIRMIKARNPTDRKLALISVIIGGAFSVFSFLVGFLGS